MKKNQKELVVNYLGEDFLEKIQKAEIYKKNTKTTVDTEEMLVALKVVPKALMQWLIANLKPLKAKDTFSLDIPFTDRANLSGMKLDSDVYSGEIIQNGQRIYEFQYRSLPSLGLVILSTFELYELNEETTTKTPEAIEQVKEKNIMNLIEQGIALNNLINEVVDRKLSSEEAKYKFLMMKLQKELSSPNEQDEAEPTKVNKLKEYLENKKKKEEDKNIECPNCGEHIYKGEGSSIKCCICYGEFFNKEIAFKKNEDGKVSFKFPKKFDQENIEMLFEAFKNKK